MSGASDTAMLRADWPAPPGVTAFTTLRHGMGVSRPPFDHFNLGARCGDDPDAVARNRAALIEHCGLPSSPRWLRQVHGTNVCHSERSEESAVRIADAQADSSGVALGMTAREPEADAAVTDAPATVLAILTADCLPVVFAATDGSEVAAAHAGWRGLAGGVLEATVTAMHTPATSILAWLGPAAGPQAYVIGREVREAFLDRDPQAADAFVATRPGHWHIDLYALARRRLRHAGIAPERIHGGSLCTISDPTRFFSHRRDTRSGRLATIIWRQ